ncbi:MAG: ATP-binding protein [Eubacterium sp.]|nr:ATP-binding protein [Eubacterium sp.]
MRVRSTDLNYLNKQYGQEGSQLLILYGQQETGMSRTVADFIQEKPQLYFYASPASIEVQRKMLAEQLENKYQIHLSDNRFETVFSRMHARPGEKLVVVIEEFQHLAKKEEEFLQSIKKLMEKKLYPAPVFVLLVCSDVVWIKEEFLEKQSLIRRQITDFYYFEELGFVDVAQEFEELPVEELIRLYGVFGGSYKYLRQIDRNTSVRENIIRLVVSDTGMFYEEAQRFLKNELREVAVYNTILSAIANGNEKLNDLYHATGYLRAKISVYMKNLSAFGVVRKVHSVETGGWENAKKGVYRIENTFLDFWFRFLYPHLTELHQLPAEEFYDKFVEPGFDLYMERYFTKVCAEYLQLMSKIGQLPIKTKLIGTWVGKKGTIDIVAQNEARERIVAKCCWQKQEMSAEDLKDLTEATKEAKIKAEYYYLFTAGKFQNDLKRLSENQQKLKLVDLTCF